MNAKFPSPLAPRPSALSAVVVVFTAACALLATTALAPAQTGWGNALSFDGADDYVLSQENIDLANQSFTVELWAKRAATGVYHQLASQGTQSSQNKCWQFAFTDANTVCFTFWGPGVYTPQAYLDTDWHHWAATYSVADDVVCIYRDGSLAASATNTAINYQEVGPLYVGRLFDASFPRHFNGMLDDVRIWNKARSQAEIQADMCRPLTGTESNLVVYWKFDEAGGTVATDTTTNHFDGTLVNGPIPTNSTIPLFQNISAALTGIEGGSVAWGDYDNDGRLDILLAGLNASEQIIAQVWRNTGAGFSNINAGLPGAYAGSVAWGDYDNDGRLDILLTGVTNVSGGFIAQVWRNTGSGFTNINAGLPGVYGGSGAWGDYDNDGRLDFLLTGMTNLSGGYIGQLWHNTGSGFIDVTATAAPGLPRMAATAVAWGDYDNDGWLDILLTGRDQDWGNTPVARLWRNTGSGFTNVTATVAPGLPGVFFGSVAWGDYDNDGRLDILLAGGTDSNPNRIAQVWRNTGAVFTNVTTTVAPGLPAVQFSSSAWGDYDNDGRLDILLTGSTSTGRVAQVWRNTGSGFTNINAGLPGVWDRSAAWGDFNNDGRLDILLAGEPSGSDPIAQVWRNNSPTANTPPEPPTGLAAAAVGDELELSWNPVDDAQTPAEGLTYNVRVGTTSGSWNIVSPQSETTNGFRRLPALGNAQHGLTALVNLPWGIYYWSVQAVDGAFAGSPFSPEATLVVAVKTLPATEVGLTTATLNGTVHPLGVPTMTWFEWGATTNYNHTTTATNLGFGNSPLQVSEVLTGLVLHTYHYRAVASNEVGLIFGSDSVIAMQLEPPQVVTLPATNLADTSATLQCIVNPMERETVAWFEYGLTMKYGALSAVTNLGGGPDALPAGIPVTGLLPWMTYHYRVVASNSVGVATGADAAVTLPGPSTVAPTLPALTDIVLPQGGTTSIVFTVSPPDADLRARGNNLVLLPASGLTLGGYGGARNLNITPDPNHSGSAQITVTASDGSQADRRVFNLTVTPWETNASRLLYLADAQRVSGEAWRFRVHDYGSGSTNYAVEYRSDLSPTNIWVTPTNVADLGGGLYEVTNGPPQGDTGFYRVRGIRWLSAGLSPAAVTVDEGEPAGVVIEFNGVYTGTVTYSWTDLSGLSYTGTVQVAGTTVAIPLPMADNTDVGQLQSLMLQLQDGAGYALGMTTASTVTIEENDAAWQGVLQTPMGALGFVLQINQTNGSLQGTLRSDVAGFFPTNVPGLPLTELKFTTNTFTAVATNVTLPALTGSPLFTASHKVDLRLDATNGQTNQNVSPASVEGVATLVSAVPDRPYLDTAVSGTFRLLKPPVIPSTNNVPLY